LDEVPYQQCNRKTQHKLYADSGQHEADRKPEGTPEDGVVSHELPEIVETDKGTFLVRISEAQIGHGRVGHVSERPHEEDQDEKCCRQDQGKRGPVIQQEAPVRICCCLAHDTAMLPRETRMAFSRGRLGLLPVREEGHCPGYIIVAHEPCKAEISSSVRSRASLPDFSSPRYDETARTSRPGI